MAQLRHHYERAFESYLRMRRMPYVAIDELQRAVLPKSPDISLRPTVPNTAPVKLKNFDFVLYGNGDYDDDARGEPPSHADQNTHARPHLLLEVKGRRIAPLRRRAQKPTTMDPAAANPSAAPGLSASPPPASSPPSRAQNWVTLDDIESLTRWQALFGPGYVAAFVFVYWCDEPLPGALFHDTFAHRGRWYAPRAIRLTDYATVMKTRSAKWRTVHLPSADFERLSRPFTDREPVPIHRRAAAGPRRLPRLPMPGDDQISTARVQTNAGLATAGAVPSEP